MSLNLNDLCPQETEIRLSERPGKVLHLKKFSLASQIWFHKRFGDDSTDFFANKRVGDVSELAYFLLKEKDEFKSLEDFQESIVLQKDKEELVLAVMGTIGMSQPVIEKLAKETALGNEPSLNPPTGAPSTT